MWIGAFYTSVILMCKFHPDVNCNNMHSGSENCLSGACFPTMFRTRTNHQATMAVVYIMSIILLCLFWYEIKLHHLRFQISFVKIEANDLDK